jgi:hypothetical protein
MTQPLRGGGIDQTRFFGPEGRDLARHGLIVGIRAQPRDGTLPGQRGNDPQGIAAYRSRRTQNREPLNHTYALSKIERLERDIKIEHRRREQDAVYQIEHSADPRDHRRGILYAAIALHQRLRQISQLSKYTLHTPSGHMQIRDESGMKPFAAEPRQRAEKQTFHRAFTDFFGLTRGINGCLPKRLPTRYAPISVSLVIKRHATTSPAPPSNILILTKKLKKPRNVQYGEYRRGYADNDPAGLPAFDCIMIRKISAITIRKSSHPRVSLNWNIIEAGIRTPSPIPTYFVNADPFLL